jgi:branched-chain amino acid transport system permease protein
MDLNFASILVADGITWGAVYALLAMATVLVFSVTRVIFIPQGEFVAFGALTLAMLINRTIPGTVWLLIGLATVVAAADAWQGWRRHETAGTLLKNAVRTLAYPVVISAITVAVAHKELPLVVAGALSLALVAPLGAFVYRIAFEQIADASVLVLLIVSVGVHMALMGAGLLFFGAEGFRNPSFWEAHLSVGAVSISGQSIIIVAVTAVLIVALWILFNRTVRGKTLQATAVNRLGARLMGISSSGAGRQAFSMAAFLGALSGLLIGATTTVFYDSGFLIALKGFVAAVFAGLASYPLAALGAIGVGLLESFGSFWASPFKEVIVFTAIIPVLLWRSLRNPHAEEH